MIVKADRLSCHIYLNYFIYYFLHVYSLKKSFFFLALFIIINVFNFIIAAKTVNFVIEYKFQQKITCSYYNEFNAIVCSKTKPVRNGLLQMFLSVFIVFTT